MKYTAILIILTIFLVGCTDNMEESSSTNAQHEPASTVIHAEPSDKSNINNPQAPDIHSLSGIAQSYSDEDGKVVLKSSTSYHESHSIGPVKLTISDVKVLNYEPAMHLIDYFHGFTHKEMKFNYIKLRVTIENTSHQSINLAPISLLETNKGENKNFEDDFYLQNLNGMLGSSEQKSGELAFILEETKLEDLTKISISTSDVFNSKNESIQKGKIIDIKF